MSISESRERLGKSESGLVAIFVTMIMIVVISLIVLGFAQISRRNQRDTLDDQLSSQAYYAAESGVNDAFSLIKSKMAASLPLLAKTSCPDDLNYTFGAKATLATGVSYTCILIDPTPQSLSYSLGENGAVIPLVSSNGAISSIKLSWVPQDGMESQSVANCNSPIGKFPNATGASAWNCKYGVLHTDLVNTSILSRAALLANTYTNFIQPVAAGGTTSTGALQKGQVIGVTCTASLCSLTMTGLGLSSYYMKVSTLYRTTDLTITGTTTAGTAVQFSNAQAQIDSTGNAQGVSRRILVSVDLTDANAQTQPNAAVTSGDSICKRFLVTPGFFQVPDPMLGGGGNPLCQQQTSGTIN